MNETPDPLDALLQHRPPSAPATAWKESILRQTSRTLRWRRRIRRTAFAGALIACYAAGMLSMRLLQAPPAVEIHHEIVYVPVEPKSVPPANVAEESPAERPLTALALEWQAVENPERRVELYRRAGDRYFDEESDLESAVRCYKRFLTACSDKDLEISPQDNWLLVTLKNARAEEKRHAKHSS